MPDPNRSPRFTTLQDWLAWQETLHPNTIDLGLARVRKVADRLALGKVAPTVITVAGTNGKGSCVAFLEAILLAAGHRVGSYTSPHFLRYNERVRLSGRSVEDAKLCTAFEAIERVRNDIPLTYFEFGTLAAFYIFKQEKVDVALLEVGLGGRLDAVNSQDADLAIITSIGLDHTEWLGADREAIGYEKAGVMRPGRPVVYGDPNIPTSIRQHARSVGARLYRMDKHFGVEKEGDGSWTWVCGENRLAHLPTPGLSGSIQLRNAASALMGLHLLRGRLKIEAPALVRGLQDVRLLGRFQCIDGQTETILDLAHNPEAVRALAGILVERPTKGRTFVVFSALADKDVPGMIDVVKDLADMWYIGPIPSSRSLSLRELEGAFASRVAQERIASFESIAHAYRTALDRAQPGDRVLGFGSVFVVAEILAELESLGEPWQMPDSLRERA